MNLQDFIHSIEIGTGRSWLFRASLAGAAVLLVLVYMASQFRGLGHVESMDAAQIARNIASGQGYTTDVIRPLAIWQLQRWEQRDEKQTKVIIHPIDPFRFPDTLNPPVYPHLLAGLFAITFQDYSFTLGNFQSSEAFGPEKAMAGLGILCTLGSALLVWLIAKELFDSRVAFLATVLFWTTDLVWRTAISGLSSPLITLLLTASAWCLVLASRGQTLGHGTGRMLLWIALAGVLQGLMALTSYTWFWLWPATTALAFAMLRPRWVCAGVFLGAAIAVAAPWCLRNVMLTGNPLGLAGFYPGMTTGPFPGDSLFSQLRPDFFPLTLRPLLKKWMLHLRYFSDHWSALAGSALAVSFFVGSWFHVFKKEIVDPLKWWVAGGTLLVLLGSCFGLLPEMDPTLKELDPVREGNTLIVWCPLFCLYGAVMLWLLVDRLNFQWDILKNLVVTGAVLLHIIPMLLTWMPPREWPVKFPPYYPTMLFLSGHWMDEERIIATDLPAATAWYGGRTSLLLPIDIPTFFEINDFVMPDRIQSLLFTPASRDAKFSTEIQTGRYRGWETLVTQRAIPPIFPFQHATFLPPLNGYYYMSDMPRWMKPFRVEDLSKKK